MKWGDENATENADESDVSSGIIDLNHSSTSDLFV